MFGSIVVGTDGSEAGSAAVREAIELAARTQARLLIVSAYEPVSDAQLRHRLEGIPDEAFWMVPHEDALQILERAASDARQGGVGAVHTFPRQGDAADAIIDIAEEEGGDLIVVGNRGLTGAKRFLLGSVPSRVSHHAPCSVLIVRTS